MTNEKAEEVTQILKEITRGDVRISPYSEFGNSIIYEFRFNNFMSTVHVATDCSIYKNCPAKQIASKVKEQAIEFVVNAIMFKSEQ